MKLGAQKVPNFLRKAEYEMSLQKLYNLTYVYWSYKSKSHATSYEMFPFIWVLKL